MIDKLFRTDDSKFLLRVLEKVSYPKEVSMLNSNGLFWFTDSSAGTTIATLPSSMIGDQFIKCTKMELHEFFEIEITSVCKEGLDENLAKAIVEICSEEIMNGFDHSEFRMCLDGDTLFVNHDTDLTHNLDLLLGVPERVRKLFDDYIESEIWFKVTKVKTYKVS